MFHRSSKEDSVVAAMRYTVRTDVKPVTETHGVSELKQTGPRIDREVAIEDGRPFKSSFSLDTHGFAFVDHKTRMGDFFDAEQLRGVYFPEAQELIKSQTGAKRVHIFDHTLRSGDAGTRETKRIREPVKAVHNDYTEWSGPQRVRDIFKDEAEALLANRFAIIQIWRAIGAPIEREPLGIADARTIEPKDFIEAERRYPDRVGEIYQFEYNPKHRWYYFPLMRRDEALVFKVYDSVKDGRARWTAHTSFDIAARPDAPQRESIEIRAFAFF